MNSRKMKIMGTMITLAMTHTIKASQGLTPLAIAKGMPARNSPTGAILKIADHNKSLITLHS